jgi:hypothetical protein
MPSQLCTIICKLVISEVVDVLAELDSTLYGIVLTIPPYDIILYKLQGLLAVLVRTLIIGHYGIRRGDLKVLEGLSSL